MAVVIRILDTLIAYSLWMVYGALWGFLIGLLVHDSDTLAIVWAAGGAVVVFFVVLLVNRKIGSG